MAKKCILAVFATLVASLFLACPNPAQPTPTPSPSLAPATMYSFSVQSDGNGTVSQSPEGTSFAEGTMITVTSVPASGYRLDGWENGAGTVVSTSNPYSFAITANTALTAVHVQHIVSLNGSVTGSGTISVSPSGASGATIDEDFPAGTEVTITAIPDTDNQFLRWEGDITGSVNPRTLTLNADTTVVAVFGSTSSTYYTVTVAADPASGGTVSPGSGLYESGDVLSFTATSNTGYLFREWADHNTDNPRSVTVSGNMTMTAVFGRVHTITASATNGTITLTPNKAQYFEGETVTVTETPNAGYFFNGWTGALSGKDATETITVGASDITIGANFGERWTILVHFAIDNNIDYTFEDDLGIVSNYLATLESIEAADTDDVLDIMLLMDSYAGAGNFTDGYYKLSGGAFSAETPVATGEINSGAVAVTTAFVDWAYLNSQGKRVMYSVFNHGSGFDDQTTAGTYGIGFDDSASDCLTHNELAQTTAYIKSKAGKNLDLFYTYACLMGGVELAWEVRSNADVLLCSEEVFPADMWSYEALAAIVANPAISGAGLATAFCDDAYDYFTNTADRSFTLAAIDLSEMQPLYNAINSFAESANAWIGTNAARAAAMDRAASASMTFNQMYYTDLGEFMDQVDSLVGGFTTQTNAVRTALSDVVVYKRARNGADRNTTIIDYDDVYGLSIFHNLWIWQNSPYSGVSYLPFTYSTVLTFGASNSWTDYMDTLSDLLTDPGLPAQDSYEPDDGSYANVLSLGVSQAHTFNNGTADGDGDLMQVTLAAGQSYTFSTGLGTNPAYPGLYLYQLSPSIVQVAASYGSFSTSAKINYTPSTSGTYVLIVADVFNFHGDYTISYDTGNWGPPSKASPAAIPESVKKFIKVQEIRLPR